MFNHRKSELPFFIYLVWAGLEAILQNPRQVKLETEDLFHLQEANKCCLCLCACKRERQGERKAETKTVVRLKILVELPGTKVQDTSALNDAY